MKKIFLAMFLMLSSFSYGQEQLLQTGKITGYIPYEFEGKEVFVLQLEGNVSGGCNTTGRFAIDSSQLKFKATRAAVMAAFHSQTPVTVFYNQTCNSFVNTWDVRWVCVGNLPC
jgi:hypothetical protein